jgi:hypothetical protein
MKRWRRFRARLLLTATTVVLASIFSGGPAVQAGPTQGEPARSGTVLNPGGDGGPGNCMARADCLTWRASGCDARLTGVNPAVLTSIVNVRELAGTTRYVYATGSLGETLTETYYEFWSANCTRLSAVYVRGQSTIYVPFSAVWMTVPGSLGPYHWAMW